jgi:cholesterol transport system auxiliary component
MTPPPNSPRRRRRPAARAALEAAVLATLLASLAGCVSLLPKAEPAQLYRFGLRPPAETPARPEAVGVFHANGQFQREAAGDRILTLTGERAAYIAGVRWVAPAEVLFDEAVVNAFDASPGRVRLVSRGEAGHSDFALRLDVRNFETEYQGGTPSVLIRVRAALIRSDVRAPAYEQMFEARAPAGENRVSAIVAAYDQALVTVLGEIAAWTNRSVG